MGIKRYELSDRQWAKVAPLRQARPGIRGGQSAVRERLSVGAAIRRALV
jgi:hypothetical protein